jgi:hypothetical protein
MFVRLAATNEKMRALMKLAGMTAWVIKIPVTAAV